MSGQLEQAISLAIQAQSQRSQIKTVSWGVVTEVTETTCTVERDNAPTLYGVLLNAIDDDLQSYVTVYPLLNSNVLVGIVENLKTEAVILKCSEVEKIKVKIGTQTLYIDKEGFIFNAGDNKGLVKIVELVDWMTKLHTDIQTLKQLLLTHPVTGNGNPLALIFNPTIESPTIDMFENKKITQ
ncbi:hypothetical protein [Dysgonomonas sp. HGC4]|uniref:hypothetical protein n=1 Tax=Dysgonomonas sp. HGC4 TaxID=1658009 RepID=UPI000680B087|nr:hypothetical protein [Dysgonomonas sp. HGC4]MBD8348577.1 hypothetical protein [Dysgonomonas sp. HGC4]